MKVFKIILYILFPNILFEYKNHRRYCKRCGQQYDLFCYDLRDHRTDFWEEMGKTFDEECICHEICRHRR